MREERGCKRREAVTIQEVEREKERGAIICESVYVCVCGCVFQQYNKAAHRESVFRERLFNYSK